MHLLYPNSPLAARSPDEQFAAEFEAVRKTGFETSFFSLEDLQLGTFRSHPPLPQDTEVLYRGWMISATEYQALTTALVRVGSRPMVDCDAYLRSHHLPGWYEALKDLTPETRIYPRDCNLEAELQSLGWSGFFIKDFVESLKTSVGSRITKPELVSKVIAEMLRFRGVIEGGFCVRRVESFLPDTERRYFVIDGVGHSEIGDVPEIVQECAKRHVCKFLSVDVADVAQRADGQCRVVEIGDGQVSDLIGWTPRRFAQILAEHFKGKFPKT